MKKIIFVYILILFTKLGFSKSIEQPDIFKQISQKETTTKKTPIFEVLSIFCSFTCPDGTEMNVLGCVYLMFIDDSDNDIYFTLYQIQDWPDESYYCSLT